MELDLITDGTKYKGQLFQMQSLKFHVTDTGSYIKFVHVTINHD